MELRHGEFYWIHAIALSRHEPLMVAKWDGGSTMSEVLVLLADVPPDPRGRWWIGHQWYNPGPGIDPISHIPKPTEK